MACGSPHPEHPIRCQAPDTHPNHDRHFAMHEGTPVEWDNENYVAPPPPPRGREALRDGMRDLANQVPASGRPFTARGTDPVPSHDGAAQANRTRSQKVADLIAWAERRGPVPFTVDDLEDEVAPLDGSSRNDVNRRRLAAEDTGSIVRLSFRLPGRKGVGLLAFVHARFQDQVSQGAIGEISPG